ncbi:MAG TPA: CDP-diacylglycerol--serine O-phosphatidyltransferase [Gemmatimonadaceae bacterium]|nr:CDP-diacylglycerol--serine O-phosphatidyltransferase [Gemmatimonadaceae bacterium]
MSDVERTRTRRAIVVLPSGFTIGNLFFGFFAIVEASRNDLSRAALYVVLGGVLDAFDGRVARATRTGSRFGEELDSLVDAISFGLAPALIMYFAVLNREGWDWIWAFLFTACAVIRLARFNVEQAGTSKTHFHGLPSPAAGMTLATYWWFSQTEWYTETAIADLPWHVMMRFVMALLAFLMISDVPYPAVPTVNFRTARGIAGAVFVAGVVLGVIFLPQKVFFPLLLGYVLFGAVKYFFLGLADRLPADDILLEEEDESGHVRHVPLRPERAEGTGAPGRRRRRRRNPQRRGRPEPGPDSTP